MSQNSFGQQSDTPMMPATADPGIRHGSGASVRSTGTRSRARSRENRSAKSLSAPSSSGARQMGHQETSRSVIKFDNIMSRVSSLEQSHRAQGQTSGDTRGRANRFKNDFDVTLADIGEFKSWVVGRLGSVARVAQCNPPRPPA